MNPSQLYCAKSFLIILIYRLDFPVVERRPIIGMTYVPACPSHATFPCGGLLVQTLGSLWFFESLGTDVVDNSNESQNQDGDAIVCPSFGVRRIFKAHKLPIEGMLKS